MAKQTTRITLYSGSRCAICAKARHFLKKHRITFVEKDVEQNPRAYKDFAKLGGRGIPLIQVGDTTIFGFQENTLLEALKAKKLLG